MEFAGKEYIYLSKLKKDKVKKLRESEQENAEDAPVIKEEDKKEEDIKVEDEKEEDETEENKSKDEELDEENDKDDISKKLKKYSKNKKKDKSLNLKIDLAVSDDANLSVCSAEFDRDMEMDNSDDKSVDEDPAPMNQNKEKDKEKNGKIYNKEIDTNVCLIKYDELEKESENNVLRLYQCEKCQAYLNKYSNLIPSNDKYNWTCEFCSHENKDLIINKVDLPLNDTIENCIAPNANNKVIKKPEKDDSSLIFCFDISGSMSQSYNVGTVLKNKFDKILGNDNKKNKFKFDNNNSDSDNDFNYNQGNTSYISRLDLVKCSIQNNINSLLKNAPNTKVGIVSFGTDIEVKGDCLSNVMMIKEKDMNNESKIKSLGEENTNLIKASINKSHKEIIKALKATEENGSTALGPAVLMSLSLLNNAKIGSRIFLCTDGMSNLGVGNISKNKEEAKEFYTKIGEMAKVKGVIINLITFQDSESEIEVLMPMIEKSGGEIIRVNPNAILDGFNDLLENEALAVEVELRMNLNKTLTFRDQEEKDLINDGSSIVQKLGNVAKETETYYELKFKKAIKLAEMKDINLEELKNLIFQIEIKYRNKNGGKFIRVISKNMKISDNKEEVEKQANYDIITACEMQKSAKLAGAGLFREAQAQAHITRKFLAKNKKISKESKESYQMFNNNMNVFNQNLEYNYRKKNNLKFESGSDSDSDSGSEEKKPKKRKKSIKKKEDSGSEEEMECDSDNKKDSDSDKKKKKRKKKKKIISKKELKSKDMMAEQIFKLSKTSQNRQKLTFQRNKKK